MNASLVSACKGGAAAGLCSSARSTVNSISDLSLLALARKVYCRVSIEVNTGDAVTATVMRGLAYKFGVATSSCTTARRKLTMCHRPNYRQSHPDVRVTRIFGASGSVFT